MQTAHGAPAIYREARKRTYVSPHSGSCIFIVDDEAVIASSSAAILQMKGFSAKFFTCPLAALAAARSETPDLVISNMLKSSSLPITITYVNTKGSSL
jgi:PleD family two-component response regulator